MEAESGRVAGRREAGTREVGYSYKHIGGTRSRVCFGNYEQGTVPGPKDAAMSRMWPLPSSDWGA